MKKLTNYLVEVNLNLRTLVFTFSLEATCRKCLCLCRGVMACSVWGWGRHRVILALTWHSSSCGASPWLQYCACVPVLCLCKSACGCEWSVRVCIHSHPLHIYI